MFVWWEEHIQETGNSTQKAFDRKSVRRRRSPLCVRKTLSKQRISVLQQPRVTLSRHTVNRTSTHFSSCAALFCAVVLGNWSLTTRHFFFLTMKVDTLDCVSLKQSVTLILTESRAPWSAAVLCHSRQQIYISCLSCFCQQDSFRTALFILSVFRQHIFDFKTDEAASALRIATKRVQHSFVISHINLCNRENRTTFHACILWTY